MARPVPGRPWIQVRVPVELRLRLEAACKRENRPLTNQVIYLIERSLAQDEARDGERLAKAS